MKKLLAKIRALLRGHRDTPDFLALSFRVSFGNPRYPYDARCKACNMVAQTCVCRYRIQCGSPAVICGEMTIKGGFILDADSVDKDWCRFCQAYHPPEAGCLTRR